MKFNIVSSDPSFIEQRHTVNDATQYNSIREHLTTIQPPPDHFTYVSILDIAAPRSFMIKPNFLLSVEGYLYSQPDTINLIKEAAKQRKSGGLDAARSRIKELEAILVIGSEASSEDKIAAAQELAKIRS